MKRISPEKLRQVALVVLGTSDGMRPKFPSRGEKIQEAMEASAQAQLDADREEVKEIFRLIECFDIGDKFGNLYVPKSKYQAIKQKILGDKV